MKKLVLGLAVVAAMGMTSCGSSPECECMEVTLDMYNQMEEAKGDQDKIAEIQTTFKDQMEGCQEIMSKIDELTEEEQEAKKKEMLESCDAAKELEAKMKK